MSRKACKETVEARQYLPDDVLLEKIASKLIDGENGCRIWTGACGNRGYGAVWNGRSNVHVHRAIYQAFHGVKLRKDQFVCHSCDNPACANIDHLWLGTAKDNTADMDKKGRRVITEKLRDVLRLKPAKGSSNNMSKLTDEQVDVILTSSDAPKHLAERFGVTRNHIYKIRNGVRWAHYS